MPQKKGSSDKRKKELQAAFERGRADHAEGNLCNSGSDDPKIQSQYAQGWNDDLRNPKGPSKGS